jgi:hypothetical protein
MEQANATTTLLEDLKTRIARPWASRQRPRIGP